MGKKGGKKKGKGKKSGGGKKGKKSGQREDEMTLQEAILAFQIQVKEKAVEDMMFELKGLQEKNKRNQARNTRLKEEQEIHIKVLLRQAKDQEHQEGEKEVLTGEDVEKAMTEVWDLGRSEEKNLEDLNIRITECEKEYTSALAQVEMWRTYRDQGAQHHATQIQLLEMELDDMQKNFEDICGHLKRQLDVAKHEVKTNMEECMAEQQHLASEKAMEQMDKVGVQEIHEYEWLKQEADIHRKEVTSLCKTVENLERENIEIISELLDCQAEDLKISRNFHETTAFDGEDAVDPMDLRLMSIYKPGYASPTGAETSAITSGRERPRSAMQAAIEDRVFSIPVSRLSQQSESEEEYQSDDDATNLLEQQEYLHLGPLELKLLCVKGEPKPIHEMDGGVQIVDGSSAEITVTRPSWPVSPPMMRSVIQATP